MTSKKISEFERLTTVTSGETLIPVVTDPYGTPRNKALSINDLTKSIPSNTTFQARATFNGNGTFNGSNTYFASNVNVRGTSKLTAVEVANNKLVLKQSFTPASANVSGYIQGTLAWDSNYLYIRVSNTTFKRVALNSF